MIKILVLFSSLVFAAPGSSQEQYRSKTAEILLKNKSLIRGSCRNFADTVLEMNGLPAIGQRKSVKGRKSFDRSLESSALPLLKDSIEANNQTVQITTEKSGAKIWVLKISRHLKPQNIVGISRFEFKAREDSQDAICELSKFLFATHPIAKKQDLTEVKVEECLDLFKIPDTKNSSHPAERALEWLKGDCALHVRYSPETMKFLKK